MRQRLPPVFAVVAALSAATTFAATDPQQLEFFEKHVRPVLSDRCYKCHSVESGKSKGGLFLDSREGLLKGGESGPALVPGQPDKSLLMKALSHEDEDLKMPPVKEGGKLPSAQIANLEAWIRMGAPDPRTAAGGKPNPAMDMTRARQHWAFQPVAKPDVPAVRNTRWLQTPVDAFVLSKLEAAGLHPAEPADPRTLIRRVTYDLTGLPPTPQEVADFVADRSANAYEKLVERLLASPHYGERWGRYWLDVARYADTRGYTVGEERRFAFPHTYRDYVIDAFNDDLPYDRFLREQIAADRLVHEGDRSALAAMGFLTLGRRGTLQDDIDDRIDVVTRGLMALTVSCARCHDHKYDPIPTADYYSLYGVFASSVEPEEKPLLGGTATNAPEYQAYLARRAEIEKQTTATEAKRIDEWLARERRKTGDYLLAAHDALHSARDKKRETLAGERKIDAGILERWISMLKDPAATNDAVAGAWQCLAAGEKDLPAAAGSVTGPLAAELKKAQPKTLKDAAAAINAAFSSTNVTGLANWAGGKNAPPNLPRDQVEKTIRRDLNNATAGFRKQLMELDWTHPGAPLRAMAMEDRKNPADARVLIRGNTGNPGPVAPRRFLEILAGPERRAFTNGSGRLELADAIASRGNPLTARVFVNRVWAGHFGDGLVRSPGDFGVRIEAPPHLDLLNWLAADFMEHGWSIKRMHQTVVLSSTYRQSSEFSSRADRKDPENLLLHRHGRRRLDFEAMRDGMLFASGALDMTVGGRSVDITKEPFSRRRTLYGFIDRLNLPALFRTFDFANPNISSPQRFSTTVPQQALFMLNSPFVTEQARALVRRTEVTQAADDAAKIAAIYQVLYQRPPAREESRESLAYLQQEAARAGNPVVRPGWQFGYGWADPLVNHVKDFKPFVHVAKERRSPASAFPEKEFGHLALFPGGGHPGSTMKHATVVRWIAPSDGTIRIEGTLAHDNPQGDGVHARILDHRGVIGEWTVTRGQAETVCASIEVQFGEAIDFVVDCLDGNNSDGYRWAPRVAYVGDYDTRMPRTAWDYAKDFSVTPAKVIPLTGWEKLAQALLISNEMMFVD